MDKALVLEILDTIDPDEWCEEDDSSDGYYKEEDNYV